MIELPALQTAMVAAVPNVASDVRALCFADAQVVSRPFGLVLAFPNGSRCYVQLVRFNNIGHGSVAALPQAAPAPVEQHGPFIFPASRPVATETVERLLRAVVARAMPERVVRTASFSERAVPGQSSRYGAEAAFTDGTLVWMLLPLLMTRGQSYRPEIEFSYPDRF